MDWTQVGGVGAVLAGVVGFFLVKLHAKIDGAASKESLAKHEDQTREDIIARRKIEEKLFDELGEHIQEDTRRFAEIKDDMHRQHLELLQRIDERMSRRH